MSSKEALEKMLTDLIWYESYFADCGYYDNKEQFDIIKKDLDRLEKLEKAFEILKNSLLLSVVEIRGHYCVCAHDNNYFMKKEEADLIKEVLENDN